MRSRYTGYVLRNEAYLRRTWASKYCPASIFNDESPQWIGLKILHTQNGLPEDITGLVEFVARYKINGRAYKLHETSEFIFENGRWLYSKGLAVD
jgi:SEC-C motif-containing protein